MRVIIPSDYFQPDIDIKNGEEIRIIQVNGWTTVPSDPDKQRFQIIAENPALDRKKLSINKTSLRSIMEEWGDESDDWKGKKLVVRIVEQQAFGELKKIIFLNPVGVKQEEEIPVIEEDESQGS
jgi:hypothetical protein